MRVPVVVKIIFEETLALAALAAFLVVLLSWCAIFIYGV